MRVEIPTLDLLKAESDAYRETRGRAEEEARQIVRVRVLRPRARVAGLAAKAYREGHSVSAIARAMGTKNWNTAREAIQEGEEK